MKVRRRSRVHAQCSAWELIPLRFLAPLVTAVTELEIDLYRVTHTAPAEIILLRRAALQRRIVALADWKNAKDHANPRVVKTIMHLDS